ncbi:MAG: 4Fe-4S binding protein [Herminiimonas sp.]|nr:4Fe-4S binding protein [Herminiimonas sp.]
MTSRYQVCNCNRTMPLDAKAGAALGTALGVGALPVATALCRQEVGTFLTGIDGVDQVVVACTQERALFAELAQTRGTVAPLRFVNIRETGGWGRDAARAVPKIAALLAAAALPDPEPVPTVDYDSGGQVLIIGPAATALPWAARLERQLEVSVLLTDATPVPGAEEAAAMLEERSFPAFSGKAIAVAGWLGAFDVTWQQANPIDLEACTRCNACITACPEGAIDLRYQIDLDKCNSTRACVVACGAIGAIDFMRQATERSGRFDLVFDLSAQPIVTHHQRPQGYFAPGADPARQAGDALELAQMVGRFEKPKFFIYKEKLCAHGRNGKPGCNACIDVCSAGAIASAGDQIRVNPNLCAGCGACTTVCPSGALAYAYPRVPDQGLKIRTMLSTYAGAGGTLPALLLYGREHGSALIDRLGRQAQARGVLHGVPARVMPIEMHHAASTGIDVWLAAIACGAANVAVLVGSDEAPQYVSALEEQMAIAQTILAGLGYSGTHLQLLQADTPAQLDAALRRVQPGAVVTQPARFNGLPDKRGTLDMALGHLLQHAPRPEQTPAPEVIALPAGAPYGSVTVNQSSCTLCMSCVGACPESALMDNADAPQLRFVEKNCVQCGLCEVTCPENAITLTPRLLLTDVARQARVINEARPHHCIVCQKPFGTVQMIDTMLAKLSQHGAFAGNLDRIKMCGDCRVVDMMANKQETRATDPTTTDLKRGR